MTNEKLLEIIAQAAKQGVTALNLSRKELKTFPREIGNLANLTELSLDNN